MNKLCNNSQRDIKAIQSLDKTIEDAIKIEQEGCKHLGDKIGDSLYHFCNSKEECKGQAKTIKYIGMEAQAERLYCKIHKISKDKPSDNCAFIGENFFKNYFLCGASHYCKDQRSFVSDPKLKYCDRLITEK